MGEVGREEWEIVSTGTETESDAQLHFVTVRAQEERVQVGKAKVMSKAAEDFEVLGNPFPVVLSCWRIQWVKKRRKNWKLIAGKQKFWRDYSQDRRGWLFRNHQVGHRVGWQTIGLGRLDQQTEGGTCHSSMKELHLGEETEP